MRVRPRGSWKYSAASAVIRDVVTNRRLRQRLMPGALPRTTDARQDVGHVIVIARGLDGGLADQRQQAREVLLVHVAEPGGDVDDRSSL